MTEELTLRVSDLERKAIVFCREKDIPFPIANYLVAFVTEATKKSGEQLTRAKELLEKWIFFCGGTKEFKSPLQEETEKFLKEQENEM